MRRRRSSAPRRRSALLLLLAFVPSGCLEQWTRAKRAPFSAVWVDAESVELSQGDVDRLERVGVSELFVEAGVVEWEGSTLRVTPAARVEVPRGSAVTLVLGGSWPSLDLDAEAAGRALVAGLRQLKIDSESRGVLPVGFHLNLAAGRGLETYGAALGIVRGELERNLFLSATVEDGWLDEPELERVLAPLSFLVCYLYGQEPEASEAARFWDLERLLGSVERIETYDRGYLVGAITRGSLAHLDGQGERLDVLASAPLQSLVEAAQLDADAPFLFEGFHRQVLEFEAKRRLRVGEWNLPRGGRLQMARTSEYHLAELHSRLGETEAANYLGLLYDRLPSRQVNLALSLDQLIASRGGSPPAPDLALGLEVTSQRSSRWVVRALLRNRGSSGTSFAAVDTNYIELKADDGVFGKVELGQFQRMELARDGRQTTRSVRNANTLRLFYPMVDPGWSVASGPIQVRLESAEIEFDLRAEFLLPDGRTYEVSRRWRPGEDEEEEEGEGQSASL